VGAVAGYRTAPLAPQGSRKLHCLAATRKRRVAPFCITRAISELGASAGTDSRTPFRVRAAQRMLEKNEGRAFFPQRAADEENERRAWARIGPRSGGARVGSRVPYGSGTDAPTLR